MMTGLPIPNASAILFEAAYRLISLDGSYKAHTKSESPYFSKQFCDQ